MLRIAAQLLLALAIDATILGAVRGGDIDSISGHIFCGYQGWFRTPDDGTMVGWQHYSQNGKFEPGSCAIDLWPDVSELDPRLQVPTSFHFPSGANACVFSSVHPGVMAMHFRWMRDYDIDGVFLQRFISATKRKAIKPSMDAITRNCMACAAAEHRDWALMYDLSGTTKAQDVIDDWKYLTTVLGVASAKDSGYLDYRGKPLVGLWGLGVRGRSLSLQEWEKLLIFFKKDAFAGRGCSILLGIPAFWRAMTGDSICDKQLPGLVAMADIISPWTVGRVADESKLPAFANAVIKGDVAWCKAHSIEYMPVVFPGFSWRNLSQSRGVSVPLNGIPRNRGRFFWKQFQTYYAAGARSFYIAMFDEVDEGTAIFKCVTTPPVGMSQFVAEPGLPNDYYLQMAKAARRSLTAGSFARSPIAAESR
jgi:hypothetical protein